MEIKECMELIGQNRYGCTISIDKGNLVLYAIDATDRGRDILSIKVPFTDLSKGVDELYQEFVRRVQL